MLQILGRSDIFLWIEIIKKIIGFIPLSIGIFFNIYWMLIGSILTGVVSFFLNSYYTGKKLGYTSWMQLKDVSTSYGIAFIIATSVYFLKYLPLSYWLILPLQIIIGTVVCLIVCEKARPMEYVEIRSIIKAIIKKYVKHENI
jgi:hypothetical protein